MILKTRLFAIFVCMMAQWCLGYLCGKHDDPLLAVGYAVTAFPLTYLVIWLIPPIAPTPVQEEK